MLQSTTGSLRDFPGLHRPDQKICLPLAVLFLPPPPTNTAYYPAISVSEQNRIRFLQIVTESGYGQQRHPAISSPKEQLLGHWDRTKAEHGPELSSCLLLGRCKDRACLCCWALGVEEGALPTPASQVGGLAMTGSLPSSWPAVSMPSQIFSQTA